MHVLLPHPLLTDHLQLLGAPTNSPNTLFCKNRNTEITFFLTPPNRLVHLQTVQNMLFHETDIQIYLYSYSFTISDHLSWLGANSPNVISHKTEIQIFRNAAITSFWPSVNIGCICLYAHLCQGFAARHLSTKVPLCQYNLESRFWMLLSSAFKLKVFD